MSDVECHLCGLEGETRGIYAIPDGWSYKTTRSMYVKDHGRALPLIIILCPKCAGRCEGAVRVDYDDQ